MVAGDQRDEVARPPRAQLGAQDDDSGGAVASEPSRPLDDLLASERPAGPEVREEGVAGVDLVLVADLLDGDVDQRCHRHQVQEVPGVVAELGRDRADDADEPDHLAPRRRSAPRA